MPNNNQIICQSWISTKQVWILLHEFTLFWKLFVSFISSRGLRFICVCARMKAIFQSITVSVFSCIELYLCGDNSSQFKACACPYKLLLVTRPAKCPVAHTVKVSWDTSWELAGVYYTLNQFGQHLCFRFSKCMHLCQTEFLYDDTMELFEFIRIYIYIYIYIYIDIDIYIYIW